jgi:hypothetical protein
LRALRAQQRHQTALAERKSLKAAKTAARQSASKRPTPTPQKASLKPAAKEDDALAVLMRAQNVERQRAAAAAREASDAKREVEKQAREAQAARSAAEQRAKAAEQEAAQVALAAKQEAMASLHAAEEKMLEKGRQQAMQEMEDSTLICVACLDEKREIMLQPCNQCAAGSRPLDIWVAPSLAAGTWEAAGRLLLVCWLLTIHQAADGSRLA